MVNYVADNRKVLDLGCATGHTARLLAERGCSVVGVEFDERAAVAADAWCQRVIVGDLDLIALDRVLEGETFDVIVAGDVLEHLRDPGAVLQSVIPLLSDTGEVVASVPNIAHGSVRLALLSGTFDYADSGILDRTHLRFFTRASIEALFESSGYAIERIEGLHAPLDQCVPWDPQLLPTGMSETVAAMPDVDIYEFVVIARPGGDGRRHARSSEADGVTDGDAVSGNGTGEARVIARLEADILRERDREIAMLRTRVAETVTLRAQLEAINQSPAWRAWRRVRPIARAGRAAARRLNRAPRPR